MPRVVADMPIKEGDTVSVHYTGKLEDGQVFDSSEGREPLEFTVGSGQLIAGFDEGVRGLDAGQSTTVTIAPEDAYGPVDEERVQQVPRQMLDAPDLEVGQVLGLQTPDGQQMQATVKELNEETVTLDFNHFLAGKTLVFDITVVNVA